MSYVSNREIASMSTEAREARLLNFKRNSSNSVQKRHWVVHPRTWEPTKQPVEALLV